MRPLTAEELTARCGYRPPATTSASWRPSPRQPAAQRREEYILRYFGEPTNGLGDFQGSLDEHLFLNNSSNMRQPDSDGGKGNLADTLLQLRFRPLGGPWASVSSRLFLATRFSRDRRLPKLSEQKLLVAHPGLPIRKNDRCSCRWKKPSGVLLNTAEFPLQSLSELLRAVPGKNKASTKMRVAVRATEG